MHFSSFSDFIAMGGYGFYVWIAFAITVLAMGWVVMDCIWTRKKIFFEIKNKIAREQRIENAKKMENTL